MGRKKEEKEMGNWRKLFETFLYDWIGGMTSHESVDEL